MNDELTMDTVTPYLDRIAEGIAETPVIGSVSRHYTVRSDRPTGGGVHEIGDVHCLHDAILIAKTFAGETQNPYHVIEHKFTQTTVAVYGAEF